jgi:hypothetical protein
MRLRALLSALPLVAAEAALAGHCAIAGPAEAQSELSAARREFGLEALRDPARVGELLLVVLGAVALGAVLAYHPFAARPVSVEDLEQPKTIITYTVVGALIAIVVAAIPAMGFAIFGIGALMRFRTQLGAAKETGRVILSTVVGLLCGLQLWMAAVVGTAVAWVIILALEARVSTRMIVRGVEADALAQVAGEYAKALRGLGCRCGPPRKNPAKGQVSFSLQMPRKKTHEEIETALATAVPAQWRGTVDWPED